MEISIFDARISIMMNIDFSRIRRTVFSAAMVTAAACSCTRTELEKMSAEDENISGKSVKLIVRSQEPVSEAPKAPEPIKVAEIPKPKAPGKTPSANISVPQEESLKLRLPGPGSSRFLSQGSFITKWFLLGPFSIPEGKDLPSQDLIHKELVDHEKTLSTAAQIVGGLKWKKFIAPENVPMGCVDASGLITGKETPAATYLYTEISSPEELPELIMHTGSACYIKVWINGNLVHAYNREPRKADMDQDTIKGISMKKGINSILVKCVNISGGWSFYMRLSSSVDIPLSFENN